ncbi:MAG: SDR family oxidoreductase [Alphaproteobacteria bacterium]|nr:SDR family oxidoreductase [Alphaproteobacteria bacterium]
MPPDRPLDGRTAIVTGAAGRLGSEFSRALCSAGASVVLADTDLEGARRLELSLSKTGTAKARRLDISDTASVRDLAEAVPDPDILVNSALFNPSIGQKEETMRLETFPLDLWKEVIDVNLTGTFLCSRVIGDLMAKKSGGSIINISSIYGMVGADQRIYGDSGLNSQPSYAATKGAILSMTRYMAAYWRGRNVRVNTLTLGGVLDRSYMQDEFIRNYSERTILGRMADRTEYNGALLFLASDASSYMTGSNLVIDGGWTAW